MPSIEKLIDDHFEKLFSEIINLNDDLYDLVIEYKSVSSGKTIRRSWREREEILKEQEK